MYFDRIAVDDRRLANDRLCSYCRFNDCWGCKVWWWNTGGAKNLKYPTVPTAPKSTPISANGSAAPDLRPRCSLWSRRRLNWTILPNGVPLRGNLWKFLNFALGDPQMASEAVHCATVSMRFQPRASRWEIWRNFAKFPTGDPQTSKVALAHRKTWRRRLTSAEMFPGYCSKRPT